jgi:hypothetical protein
MSLYKFRGWSDCVMVSVTQVNISRRIVALLCGSRSVPMDQYLSIATYCVVCVSHGDSRRCGRPFRWWMSMANFLFFQWAQKTHTRPLWHVRKDCIRISVFFFSIGVEEEQRFELLIFVWFDFVLFSFFLVFQHLRRRALQLLIKRVALGDPFSLAA